MEVTSQGDALEWALPGDFRYEAAGESVRLLAGARLSNVLNSERSLCVPLAGDVTGQLYRIAVVPWLLLLPGVLLILFAVVYVVLIVTPWVSAGARTFTLAGIALSAGVTLLALSERVSNALFDGAVLRRHGGALVNDLRQRVGAYHQFAIEDPASYQKQKVISEDYAMGGLDRTGHGLLILGLRYQYVVRPGDVTEVRVDKNHILITMGIGAGSVTLAVSPFISNAEEAKRFKEEVVAALGPGVGV
jgi:hypothetical protein